MTLQRKKAEEIWETMPDLKSFNAEDGIDLIEQALVEADREGYERGVREAAETAAKHRTGDIKYLWKACSAEIVESILNLIPQERREEKK